MEDEPLDVLANALNHRNNNNNNSDDGSHHHMVYFMTKMKLQ